MLAKKQKQQASNMSNQDDNTVVLGSGYGAGTDYISAGAGADTISIDTSSWTTGGFGTMNGGYTIGTGSITSPYTYTTNGTAGYTINNNPTTVHIDADGLTMKEGADIKIGGKSLTEAIEKIEERLGILHPNPELEGRWETLKDLRRQYMEMEKDILEKEKIMKILKEK